MGLWTLAVWPTPASAAQPTWLAAPDVYSTFLSWNGDDFAVDVAMAPDGSIFVVGETNSTDFPNRPSRGPLVDRRSDVFLIKMNASGASLDFAVWLGGSDGERAGHVVVGSRGDVWITGFTYSDDFPTTSFAIDSNLDNGLDPFIARFSQTDGTLLASSMFGSTATYEQGLALAVSAGGNPVIAGEASSAWFPVTAGAYSTQRNGTTDAYVAELNSSLTGVVAASFLGGSYSDSARAVAVGPSGRIFVAGHTGGTGFPTTPGANLSGAALPMAFVSIFSADLSTLERSTLARAPIVLSMAVDLEENVYVGGYAQGTFTATPGAFDTTLASRDAFAVKLNANLSRLVYATLIGGSDSETGLSIGADSSGRAYVVGWTNSTDFPLVNPFDNSSSAWEAFVTVLDENGTQATFSSFFGGAENEWGNAVHSNGRGGLLLCGYTFSADFPVTADALMQTGGNAEDGFVVNIDFDRTPTARFNATPAEGPVETVFAFDASPSSDFEDSFGFLQFRWDFDGDGAWDTSYSAGAWQATHSYARPGTYTVLLDVRDTNGGAGRAYGTVVVTNRGPTARFGADPETAPSGEMIAFNASLSSDFEDALPALEFRWDFDGDGFYDTGWSHAPTVTFAFASPGNYSVTLEVRDSFGAANTTSALVRILDAPPSAALDLDPPVGTVADLFHASASNSTDQEDGLAALQFQFDWDGDGVPDTAWTSVPTFDHRYSEPGTYSVTVWVRDSAGHTASSTGTLTVVDTPPLAKLEVDPPTGLVTTRFRANVSGSSDLEDPFAALYFRFGLAGNDSVGDLLSSWPTWNFSYIRPGTYEVVVWVLDTAGNVGVATATVTVLNSPPVARLAVLPGVGNLTTLFTLDAGASTDIEPLSAAIEFRFDLGNDGTFDTDWGSSSTALWRPGALGEHMATVEVRDEGGLVGRVSVRLSVVNEPPRAVLALAYGGAYCVALCNVEGPFRLDARNSTDLEDLSSALRFRFDLDGDGAWDTDWAASATVDHAFTELGISEVRVQVSDSAGATASASLVVEFAPPPVQPPTGPPVTPPPTTPARTSVMEITADVLGLMLLLVAAASVAIAVALRYRRASSETPEAVPGDERDINAREP